MASYSAGPPIQLVAPLAVRGVLGRARRRLVRTPDRFLVPAIVLTAGALTAQVLGQTLIGLTVAGSEGCLRVFAGKPLATTCGPTVHRGQLAFLLGLFVFLVIGQLFAAGMSRATLDAIDGAPVRGPFSGWSVVQVLPTAAAVAGAITLGAVVCLVPGLVAAFALRYAVLISVDRKVGVLASLRGSAALVFSDVTREAGFALRSTGVLLLGLLCIGIGLFVAVPTVLLAQTERYRLRVPAAA
ncbi:MAG: proline rich protein [Marmoricola sp.]|nr:proline rich protein [Marmoricola sp.]